MKIVRCALTVIFSASALFAQAQALTDDPDSYFKGKMGGTFGKDVVDVLPAAKRVAIAALRVAFVTDNSVSAQVRASYLPGRDSSGARSSFYIALEGVSPRSMQAIADKAYAELVSQIAASGREVVPMNQMTEFFASVNATPSDIAKPYVKESGGQTASIFAPTGMPLVFIHFDGQWGDRGSFDLNNYRRMEEYSAKWNAAVIAPLIVVNFAKMSSSGNQSGFMSNSAETGAELSMSVSNLQSFYSRSAEYRNGMGMGGDQGAFSLTKPIASALPFGTFKETAKEDNSAVKGIFDIIGRAAGLANAGGAARSSKRGVAETNDEAYSAAATDAIQRMAATMGEWFKKHPPLAN